jgi:hypothetical protein|tara:strand:+ start:731 stop:1084 length:354 start_codon:yes stop_codon:yes gene_type:complete
MIIIQLISIVPFLFLLRNNPLDLNFFADRKTALYMRILTVGFMVLFFLFVINLRPTFKPNDDGSIQMESGLFGLSNDFFDGKSGKLRFINNEWTHENGKTLNEYYEEIDRRNDQDEY